MTNAILGFSRLNSVFTLSGGSYETRYPRTNFFTDEYARVARTTSLNAADTQVTGTSSYIVAARCFGIFAHNMTLEATFRLRLYDNSGSPTTLVYDSGVQNVWPPAYGYKGRYWETFNFWTGQYSESEMDGQIPGRAIVLDQVYFFDQFLLEFFDADNPSGYIQVGTLDINEGWEVSANPEVGAEYGYQQFTRVNEIEGGLKRFEVFTPSYVFRGSIPAMDRSEVQNKAVEMYRQHGLHLPLMWIPEPDDTARHLREAKMVTLAETDLFNYITADYDSVPLNLIEWKG